MSETADADRISHNRGLWELVNERYTAGATEATWARRDLHWGLFEIPEQDVGALGEVRDLDAVELAAGTAHVSAWLARSGARAVAVDLSRAQLTSAARAQRRVGPTFPLLEADGEHVPLRAGAFDLVVSEHGVAAWCDPARWVPEAARLLRPGGRLVFLTNSLLSALCVPDGPGHADAALRRGQREVARVRWDGGGIEHHPSHGEWIGHLRRAGFSVEALLELYAPAGAAGHDWYEIVTPAWARRWPAEELWVARRHG